MSCRVPLKLKSLWSDSIIGSLLMHNIPLLLILKYVIKSLLKLSPSEPLGLQKSFPKNILDPMKLFSSLVHYCLLSVFQSLCTLSIWFSMCLSNSFPERTQPASTLVIIDRKPEYEISQIVDSKINCWQVYKLLYKVIWLEYKDTEDKFE